MEEASKVMDYNSVIEWRTFSFKTTSSDWIQIWDSLKRNKLNLESELSKSIDFGSKENVSTRQGSFDALLGTLWDASRLVEAQLKEYQVHLIMLSL